jgi:hypothetical protein
MSVAVAKARAIARTTCPIFAIFFSLGSRNNGLLRPTPRSLARLPPGRRTDRLTLSSLEDIVRIVDEWEANQKE